MIIKNSHTGILHANDITKHKCGVCSVKNIAYRSLLNMLSVLWFEHLFLKASPTESLHKYSQKSIKLINAVQQETTNIITKYYTHTHVYWGNMYKRDSAT